MRPSEYVYILAWARVAGLPDRWALLEQALAALDGAPADALYRTDLGQWVCVGDVESLAAQDVIERYVAGIDAVSASEVE